MSAEVGRARRHRVGIWIGPVVALYACGDPSGPDGAATVATVTVTPAAVVLVPGDTVRLTARARSADGAPMSGHTFTWRSSRASVAAVDATGLVTGIGEGTATITAGAGGRSGDGAVQVLAPSVPVASVLVEPEAADLHPGDTLRLRATLLDEDGALLEDRVVTWAVDRPEIVTVDAAGLASAHAIGDAAVTATSEGVTGSTALRVVAVTSAAPVVSALEPSTIQSGWGSFTLVVRGDGFDDEDRVRWGELALETTLVAPTELRAIVSSDLLSTPRTVEVTVGTVQGTRLSNATEFTVTERPAHTVEPRLAGNAVFVGDRTRLAAVARDQFGEVIEAKTVTWTSSDTMVARIEAGYVRGLRTGSVDLVASAVPTSVTVRFSVVEAPVTDVVFEAPVATDPGPFVRGLAPVVAARRLLPPGVGGRQASLTADGGQIAFVGRDELGNDDVYTIRRDGSGLVRLTSAPGIDDQPAWSPDGAFIAFRSFRDGKSDVWVMDADGANPRNLTHADVFLPEESNDRPAWAPDGGRLAFSRGFGLGRSIYTVRVDGTGMSELTSEAGQDLLEPSWSPGGDVIAFRRHDRVANVSTIAFVTSDGGNGVVYAQTAPVGSRTPVFLPDGWIVVDAPVIPGSGARAIAFVDLSWGSVVVPVDDGATDLAEPRVVR